MEEQSPPSEPVALGNSELVHDLVVRCNRSKTTELRELANLLCRPHLRALIDTHDEVGRITSDKTPRPPQKIPEDNMHADMIRMVGVHKSPNEPLGLTVEQEDNGNLVVRRILSGGMIDKQGLIHVGDVILEVNGEPVDTPEDLLTEIAKAKENITLKIGPSNMNGVLNGQLNGLPVGRKLTVSIIELIIVYEST